MKSNKKPIERKTGINGTYLNLYPKSKYDPTEYERPTYTADNAIFRVSDSGVLEILLIQRGQDPFKGKWAFPAGFVNIKDKENSEMASIRELKEETGLQKLSRNPIQFKTYSDWDRDPRWHTVSTVYYYLMRKEEWNIKTFQFGDDAADGAWVNAWDLVKPDCNILAFDHKKIINQLLEYLKSNAWKDSLAFQLTPSQEFTLPELRVSLAAIKGIDPDTIDAGNFNKSVRMRYKLVKVADDKKVSRGRPATKWKMISDNNETF
jgi:8-oxo-dGTP diphosphatase